MSLFKKIETQVVSLNIATISDVRRAVLNSLVDSIQAKVSAHEAVRINFICTHNSRRSHLSQVWAQTMAYYFGINNVTCYSGGTEATALFPAVAETLTNTGFEVKIIGDGNNPVYAINYAENEHPIIGFSKIFDNDFNPKTGFIAILTCDSANEACPSVAGAEKRLPITFEDPKVFDGTPQKALKYNERSMQIATEMMYVFQAIT